MPKRSLSPRLGAARKLEQTCSLLADFRFSLTRFLLARNHAARKINLEPKQYELLLAVKTTGEERPLTLKELAAQLHIQHHTMVGLVNRAEERNLVRRRRSVWDKRAVVLEITGEGERALNRLVEFSFSELRHDGPQMERTLLRLCAPR
jgi:DNA-binding MarR family transcriptional regulator